MRVCTRHHFVQEVKDIKVEAIGWNPWKKHVVAIMGELVGTILFLWFALAGTSFANIPSAAATGNNNTANAANVLYISLVFGFSLAINAWIFFRVSGGLFNPSITFGLMIMGIVPLFRGILLIFAQFAGGIIAAYLVSVMFPTPLRAETLLSAGTTVTQGLFIEMFLTTLLLLSIFMLAAEKSRATFIAPIGIGLAFFVAELVGVFFTGGSLNPARTLGPALVNKNFPSYFWIYWIGPLIGTLIACAFYEILIELDYRSVLPNQDADSGTIDYAQQPSDREKSRLLRQRRNVETELNNIIDTEVTAETKKEIKNVPTYSRSMEDEEVKGLRTIEFDV